VNPAEATLAEQPVMQRAARESYRVARAAATGEEILAWAETVVEMEQEATASHWPLTACGPGCAHCCHIPVEVSPVEVTILHRASCLLPGYEERVRASASADAEGRVACPLLVANRCVAYAARPAACRGENSTSAEECAQPRGSHHYYGEVRMLSRSVIGGATIAFGERGLDVRPLLLRRALAEVAHLPPDEPLERWLAGEVLFSPASRMPYGRRVKSMLLQISRRKTQLT